MIKGILIAAGMLLTACTTFTYKEGDFEFSRTSIGTQLQIAQLEVTITKQGKRVVKVSGYVSDQVQAMEKIAEGAARGAASAVNPLP